jgi:hypothetical protein
MGHHTRAKRRITNLYPFFLLKYRLMKKSLTIAAILLCALVGAAFAAGIAEIPWNESNIQTLRGFDKSSVDALVNNLRGGDPMHAMVGGFGWYDLAGDHHYELVATEDLSGRAFFDYLAIYGQDSAGKPGCAAMDRRRRFRHGPGQGGQRPQPRWQAWTNHSQGAVLLQQLETFTWPAVYRLENGKYVEASRDFLAFYDKEILSALDQDISEAQARTDARSRPQDVAAVPTMKRDKILRVLGRDPTAGLREAYQWMNSDDRQVLQCAIVTFDDIGGHDQEKRAASEALERALDREKAARKGS